MVQSIHSPSKGFAEKAQVSPYLLRPLRSLEQALAERQEQERLVPIGDRELQRSLDDLRDLLDREFPVTKERAA